jgi:uncharacterized protein
MTQPLSNAGGPQLSVRADAHRSVPPDSAVLYGVVSARLESKTAAVAATAVALNGVLVDLAALDGVADTAGDERRRPLTWLVGSASSYPEYDQQTGAGQTGHVVASAELQLTVRDFGRLDELSNTLARHEAFNVSGVSWRVDFDNPTWSVVRADAIRAAIAKARDYAAALGGELQGLEHLADTGLLGSDAAAPVAASARSYSLVAHAPQSPSLDPVPQDLVASIEARFTMTPVALAAR